jgi:hypothetical protein
MEHYVRHDVDGHILSITPVSPMVLLLEPHIVADLPKDCKIENYYVKDGQVFEYTASELLLKREARLGHKWDPQTRTWQDLRDLNEKKRDKLFEFKKLAEKENEEPITYNSVAFQANAASKALILEAAQEAATAKIENETFSVKWFLLDNSFITLNATQILRLHKAVRQRTQTLKEKLENKRAAILAAQDETELNSIIW